MFETPSRLVACGLLMFTLLPACGSDEPAYDTSTRWLLTFGPDYVTPPAMAADGTTYVGINNSGVSYSERTDKHGNVLRGVTGSATVGQVFAIDQNGKTKWHRGIPTGAGTPVLTAQDQLLIPSSSGLQALSSSGKALWFAAAAGSPTLGPDGTIFVAGNGGIVALSPTGQELWRNSQFAAQGTPLLTGDGHLWVVAALKDAKGAAGSPNLLALDLRGVVTHTVDLSKEWEISTPAPDGKGNVLLLSKPIAPPQVTRLRAFGPDGSALWSIPASGSAQPLVDKAGNLYVDTDKGLTKLGADHKPLWSYPGISTATTTLGDDGRLYGVETWGKDPSAYVDLYLTTLGANGARDHRCSAVINRAYGSPVITPSGIAQFSAGFTRQYPPFDTFLGGCKVEARGIASAPWARQGGNRRNVAATPVATRTVTTADDLYGYWFVGAQTSLRVLEFTDGGADAKTQAWNLWEPGSDLRMGVVAKGTFNVDGAGVVFQPQGGSAAQRALGASTAWSLVLADPVTAQPTTWTRAYTLPLPQMPWHDAGLAHWILADGGKGEEISTALALDAAGLPLVAGTFMSGSQLNGEATPSPGSNLETGAFYARLKGNGDYGALGLMTGYKGAAPTPIAAHVLPDGTGMTIERLQRERSKLIMRHHTAAGIADSPGTLLSDTVSVSEPVAGITPAGEMLLFGPFQDALDIDTEAPWPKPKPGTHHQFVQRFDSNGAKLSKFEFLTAEQEAPLAVAGSAAGEFVIVSLIAREPMPPKGTPGLRRGETAVVRKFDEQNKLLWKRLFPSAMEAADANPPNGTSCRISLGQDGSVLLGGSFGGSIHLGFELYTNKDPIYTAGWAVLLGADGTPRWSTFIPGGTSEGTGTWIGSVNDVALDAWGNAVLTGSLSNAVQSGGWQMTSSSSLFTVASIGPCGDLQWALPVRSCRACGATASIGIRPTEVEVDLKGDITVAGTFAGALDIGAFTIQGAGTDDSGMFDADLFALHLKGTGDSAAKAGTYAKACKPQAAVLGELTVEPGGGGSGRIVSDPPGIDCPGQCSAIFSAEKPVVLTATPGPDSTLVAWSGPCQGHAGCSITVVQDTHVGVRWDKPSVTLLQTFGGATVIDAATAMDANGSVWTAAAYSDGVLNMGAPLTSTGGVDVGVAVHDMAGQLVWSKSFGGAQAEYGPVLAAVPQGGAFLEFASSSDTLDVGTGPLAKPTGLYTPVIVRLDAAGKTAWAMRLPLPAQGAGAKIDVRTDGSATLVFPADSATKIGSFDVTLTAAGSVVVEVSPAGEITHAFALPSLAVMAMTRLSTRVIVAGSVQKATDLGLGPLPATVGLEHVLVALDLNGKALWQKAKLPEATHATVRALAPLPDDQWLAAIHSDGGLWQGQSPPPRLLGRYDADGTLLSFLGGVPIQSLWHVKTNPEGSAVVVADIAASALMTGLPWPAGALGRTVFAWSPAGEILWARASFTAEPSIHGVGFAGKRCSVVGNGTVAGQVLDWGGVTATAAGPSDGWRMTMAW